MSSTCVGGRRRRGGSCSVSLGSQLLRCVVPRLSGDDGRSPETWLVILTRDISKFSTVRYL